jgi:hypothetical protein
MPRTTKKGRKKKSAATNGDQLLSEQVQVYVTPAMRDNLAESHRRAREQLVERFGSAAARDYSLSRHANTIFEAHLREEKKKWAKKQKRKS